MNSGNVNVANPKDIIEAAMGNITAMSGALLGAWGAMKLGYWEGDMSTGPTAAAMPVFMIQEAVESMKKIKEIGKEFDEQQRKEKILFILNIVLMVLPFVGEGFGAIFGGAAAVARVAALLAETGNAAVSVYQVIEDPSSAPIVLIGMLVGIGGGGRGKTTPQKFKEAASARALLKPEQLAKFSEAFRKKNIHIETITKACARR